MSSIVDHIAILVEDLNSSVEWYLKTLGGTVTHKQENYVRIKAQNTNIALLDKNFSSSKPHIAILCDKRHYLIHLCLYDRIYILRQ